MIPDHEREEMVVLIKDVVEGVLNKMVVRSLIWIIVFLAANLSVLVAGLWMFWQVQEKAATAITDRWTGTMEATSELHRRTVNPDYHSVDIRTIQKDYYPQ
jgi:hypothetical protein